MKKILVAVIAFMFTMSLSIDSPAQIGNLFKKKSNEKTTQEEKKKEETPSQTKETPAPEPAALKPHLTPNTKSIRINSYSLGKAYSDGMLYIQNNSNNKHGYLDTEGNLKIGYVWNLRGFGNPKFNGGYCVVDRRGAKGTEWFIIDHDGKETALPSTYFKVSDFYEGRAIAYNSVNGKTSVIYIDHTGKPIFPELTRNPKFSLPDPECPRPYKDGLAAFYDVKEEKWGFHDTKGKLIIPAIYKNVDDFSEGFAAVSVVSDEYPHGRWGYIDVTGKMMIEPKFGNKPSYFSEGTAVVVKQNGKACAINKAGEIVSEEFGKLTPFFQGYAFALPVASISEVYVVDKEFKIVNKIKSFPFPTQLGYSAIPFYNGLAAVGSNSLPDAIRGRIINTKGETVISQEGTNASIGNFYDGLAYCYARLNGTYYEGFINDKGEYVFIFEKEEF